MNLHARANAVHCSVHAAEAGAARAALGPDEIAAMETAIEKLLAAFERPGQWRYRVRVIHAGRKIDVVYDTALRCIVTVLMPRIVP